MDIGSSEPITDVFYSASLSQKEAEKLYSQLLLTEEYFEKILWSIDSKGVRTKIKEEKYSKS